MTKMTIALAAGTTPKKKPRKKPRSQSAVVPWRKNGNLIEIMLVRTIQGKNWGIPKGGLEDDHTKRGSAAKEAYEEAGVLGDARKKLGSYRYVKGKTGRPQEVVVYLLKVKKTLIDWPEKNMRVRAWVPIKDAKKMVPRMLRDFIKSAEKQINK